jgi:hypothetical protein
VKIVNGMYIGVKDEFKDYQRRTVFPKDEIKAVSRMNVSKRKFPGGGSGGECA